MFQADPAAARPRTIGEVLDRAVTLGVRNAGPLVVTLAVAAVPVALLNLAFAQQSEKTWSLLGGMIAARAAGHLAEAARLNREMAAQSGSAAPFIGLALTGLLWPLARTAYFRVLAAADAGLPIDVRAALGIALRRWPAQLGLGAITLAAAVPLVIAWFLLLIVVAVGLGFLAVVLHLAAVFGVVIGLMSAISAFVLYGIVGLVYDLGSVAVALEDVGPVGGFAAALRRVFDRRLLRRSLLVGLAILVLTLAGLAVGLMVGGGLAAILRVGFVTTGVATIVALGTELFRLAFVATYSADVRIRREGLDLALAAGAIDASAG